MRDMKTNFRSTRQLEFARRHRRRRTRATRGFTLVEMLVVVSIIGLLAALVTSTVMEMIATARKTAIAVEMGQMELVLSMYNDPPPSALKGPVFEGYLQRLFPRYDMGADNDNLAQAMNAIFGQFLDAEEGETYDYGSSQGDDQSNVLRGDWALVFWLVGFSGDPEDPLRDHGLRMTGQLKADKNAKQVFGFEKERLSMGSYARQGNTGHSERKYYYVDFREYGRPVYKYNFIAYRNGVGANGDYYNEDTYQIINPGRDGLLGVGQGVELQGLPYDGEDGDNMTNFSGNKTMYEFSDE